MKIFINLSLCLLLLSDAQPGTAQIDTTHGFYLIDSCDFETPCAWIVLSDDTTGIWQIGTIRKPGFDSAYSPENAVVTDTATPYPILATSCFELDLEQPGWTGFNLILSFTHQFQTDTLIDGGYLEISHDNGHTWTNVLLDQSAEHLGFDNLYTETDTLAGGGHGFSGSSSNWMTTSVQWVWGGLTKGTDFGIKIRFCFKSDSIQTNKAGWLIDDIKLFVTGAWGDIEEANAYHALKVYPNPAVNQLHLQFNPPTIKTYSVVVYNMLGQQLTTPQPLPAGSSNLDLSTYPPGVYTIQVRENQQVVTYKRFIKR